MPNTTTKTTHNDTSKYKVTIPTIDPEFANLIPPLSQEEREQLEANILAKRKCHDPIVLWKDIILDGHNRFEICIANNIQFEVKEMHFKTRSEAMSWMLENQLGRRNLHAAARIELVEKKRVYLEAMAKKRLSWGGRNKGIAKGNIEPLAKKTTVAPVPDDTINVRAILAAEAGVSERTFHRYHYILKHGTPDLIFKVQTGQQKIGNAYNQLKDEHKIMQGLTRADRMFDYIHKYKHLITNESQKQDLNNRMADLAALINQTLLIINNEQRKKSLQERELELKKEATHND